MEDNKKASKLLGLMSLIYASSACAFGSAYDTTPKPRRSKEVKPIVKKSESELKISKGLKLFVIDGVEVYAMNEKNAIRKAKNKKESEVK